ncbi:Cadmium, cobalt and zinc/H(+)-K(+) antiporter [compost metagenome]
MGHGHHHHHHLHLTGRKLAIAFFLSFFILAVLVVGGIMSRSLALLADAGHVVTDIAALGLSWYATAQALRPADQQRTFGYHRTGILAALANAVTLIVIAVFISYEAYQRLWAPQAVESGIMMGAAAVGLFLNLGIGWWLKDESEHNLNVRSAFLHVIGDAAASAGVIVGAIIIMLTGWHIVDPILSVAIAVFIAYGAWQVLDESLHILMEGVPRGLDLNQLVADVRAIPGVVDMHELHVWSISSGLTSLSCHLLIEDQHVSESMAIIGKVNSVLGDKYHIEHTTIQAEAAHCSPDSPDCNLSLTQPASGHSHHGHGHEHHDHDHHDHDHDHDHHGHAHHHPH